ncbi:MAG: metalloregulator ArsR/SmtB family transcription factor [archaeon]|jgi:DNA-binding transcriptional ArsR family regulator
MKEKPGVHKCMEILGNKLRSQIIGLLIEKPRTVQEICTELGREQSLVSHALTQLRKCSFVDYRKEGKTSIYYLKSDIFSTNKNKTLFEIFEDHAEKHCKCRHA